MSQEKSKGIPRRSLKSRGKYALYRSRKGGSGRREHRHPPKPNGVLVRAGGAPPGVLVSPDDAIACARGRLS